MEQWLPVIGFESLYEVSDGGRVRGLRKGKILHPGHSGGGYPLVNLYRDGKSHPRYVHHLVLEAFEEVRPFGLEARHLDGNAASAALYDEDGNRRLVWGTSSQNKFDEVRHGTHYEAGRDHCDNGHEFTPANTRIQNWPDGSFKQRDCRECGKIRAAERRKLRESDERRCKEDGCEKPYFGRGWCAMHYARWRNEQPGMRERNAAATQRYYAKKIKE